MRGMPSGIVLAFSISIMSKLSQSRCYLSDSVGFLVSASHRGILTIKVVKKQRFRNKYNEHITVNGDLSLLV